MNNGAWCFHLIDQLVCQGVERFCIAPGSRSAPLALAVARHPKAKSTVHYDERGIAFLALGCSLASGKCTAIITTSGTAVGNLLPAVMEAKHSSIPLLLLTADRPPELQNCGANQTTDQFKIFQNFLEGEIHLPPPDLSLSVEYVRSQAAFAHSLAIQRSGPVQINCQFREPLFTPPQFFPEGFFPEGKKQPYFLPSPVPTREQLAFAREKISRARRGLIVIGRLGPQTDPEPILNLGLRLGWPVFTDILSRAQGIRSFDFAIRTNQAPPPDFVLHFGGGFVSKFLPAWIEKTKAEVLHIEESVKRIDPHHVRPSRILANPALFCQELQATSLSSSYLEEWQEIRRLIEEAIDECFREPHSFVEPDFMRRLGPLLPKDSSLFLANSMPIRDAGAFCNLPRFVFCNRGLSGIDGQIATAAGAALSTGRPMAAVLGDQSCLHDLNSLPLLHQVRAPFLLVVSNNFGCGIFSHLPIAGETEHFEKFFAASHEVRFDSAAKMFSIPYSTDPEEPFPSFGPRILEIFTSREENTCFQKRVLEKCSFALSAKRSACLEKF